MRRLLFTLALAAAIPAFAIPTTVTVRAVSHDAKVIGTHVGGARITIRNLATGRVLAEGTQLGGTGDTKKIMSEPRARGAAVYATEGTAAFVTSIDIDEPTLVEITAVGPLGNVQATRKASKTLLLVPGEHITGEGVLLEIHGFIIDIVDATAGHVRAKITMTCGCPIESGGMWDADKFKVTATLLRAGKTTVVPMHYAGETSMFEASLPDVGPGTYELRIVAADAANANFGMATRELTVAAK